MIKKTRKVDMVKRVARISEVLIVLFTIYIIPKAFEYAEAIRQYKAYGGEYLILIFTMIVILAIETLLEERK